MDQAGLTDTSGDVTSSSENSSQVRGSQCEVSGPAAATALGKLGWEWTGVMTIIVRFYSVSRGASTTILRPAWAYAWTRA